MDILSAKQRFGIIGNNDQLNRALETALTVAPTHLSVLVTGESGVGKESIPQIIHAFGTQKHNKYVALNCGAIPEGTMDSELFGHVKGSFTGAHAERKGYFEEADGGTIFLDEIAEMPLATQVKLLRVLESGEFIKVGSSKVLKTNVRVIAATNVDIPKAIKNNKFREDLYYRLSTVEINIPPLRERQDDIHLLFRKFASDFSQKYKMPTIRLDDHAVSLLIKYRWPGNIRQLRNIAEQISVLEENRAITAATLNGYLPNNTTSNLPAVVSNSKSESDFSNEREILYKVLFDMKGDLNDLKKLTMELLKNNDSEKVQKDNENLIRKIYGNDDDEDADIDHDTQEEAPRNLFHLPEPKKEEPSIIQESYEDKYHFAEEIQEEETLSLQEKEVELIKKSLERNRGKRKAAATELGISERTLYRKIKQYDL